MGLSIWAKDWMPNRLSWVIWATESGLWHSWYRLGVGRFTGAPVFHEKNLDDYRRCFGYKVSRFLTVQKIAYNHRKGPETTKIQQRWGNFVTFFNRRTCLLSSNIARAMLERLRSGQYTYSLPTKTVNISTYHPIWRLVETGSLIILQNTSNRSHISHI